MYTVQLIYYSLKQQWEGSTLWEHPTPPPRALFSCNLPYIKTPTCCWPAWGVTWYDIPQWSSQNLSSTVLKDLKNASKHADSLVRWGDGEELTWAAAVSQHCRAFFFRQENYVVCDINSDRSDSIDWVLRSFNSDKNWLRVTIFWRNVISVHLWVSLRSSIPVTYTGLFETWRDTKPNL